MWRDFESLEEVISNCMAERNVRSKRGLLQALRGEKSVSSVQLAYQPATCEAVPSHSHDSCCIDNIITSGSLYAQLQRPYVSGTIIHLCSHVAHCPADCISMSWIHRHSR